jgi:ribosomal protein L7/L12
VKQDDIILELKAVLDKATDVQFAAVVAYIDEYRSVRFPQVNELTEEERHASPLTAIKSIRARLGCSLKEAKDKYDRFRK